MFLLRAARPYEVITMDWVFGDRVQSGKMKLGVGWWCWLYRSVAILTALKCALPR